MIENIYSIKKDQVDVKHTDLVSSTDLIVFNIKSSLVYGYKRLSKRGNGEVSRTCSTPAIHATVLSKPNPKPL